MQVYALVQVVPYQYPDLLGVYPSIDAAKEALIRQTLDDPDCMLDSGEFSAVRFELGEDIIDGLFSRQDRYTLLESRKIKV